MGSHSDYALSMRTLSFMTETLLRGSLSLRLWSGRRGRCTFILAMVGIVVCVFVAVSLALGSTAWDRGLRLYWRPDHAPPLPEVAPPSL